MYCDGFAQDLAGPQTARHVLAPALRNSTVKECCATVCSDHVIPSMT
jgi:hypothetical protein